MVYLLLALFVWYVLLFVALRYTPLAYELGLEGAPPALLGVLWLLSPFMAPFMVMVLACHHLGEWMQRG